MAKVREADGDGRGGGVFSVDSGLEIQTFEWRIMTLVMLITMIVNVQQVVGVGIQEWL